MNTPSGNTAPGWYGDPSGRHEVRVWDGVAWATQVCNGGVLGGYDSTGGPDPVV